MKKINSDFDREWRLHTIIFWGTFGFVVLMFIGILSFQGYMAFRYGPKALQLMDKGLNTADKALDKADKFMEE